MKRLFISGQAVLFCAAGIMSAAARAQDSCDPSGRVRGEANDLAFSRAARAGDVDGDGHDDFIVGSWSTNYPFGSPVGAAYLYSGRTNERLYSWYGPGDSSLFGLAVAGNGDVNGDGVPDIAVGATQAISDGMMTGQAFIYSGADGSLLQRIEGTNEFSELGASVAIDGDYDGDGFDDVLIGAPRQSRPLGPAVGQAWVYSGRTGAVLGTWYGVAVGQEFGSSVAWAGDVDGDGRAEAAVGAASGFVMGLGNAGTVQVFRGGTGREILHLTASSYGEAFGTTVARLADIDGDSVSEIVVGAPLDSSYDTNSGSASVFSGRTGARLFRFAGRAPGEIFGIAVDDAGDADHDGVHDILIGAEGSFPTVPGFIHLYSGATGLELCSDQQETTADFFGNDVAGVGDLNADGLDDYVATSLGGEVVYQYSGFCAGFAVSAGTLTWGETARISIRCGPREQRVYVAYSLAGEGSTPVPPLNIVLDLARPALAGSTVTDRAGDGLLEAVLPEGWGTRLVWLQAAAQGAKSSVTVAQINPH